MEEAPLAFGEWEGLFVTELHDPGQHLVLGGSRTRIYPHPDCPEGAKIPVHEFIVKAKSGDKEYPILYMLLQAQKAAMEIVKEIKKK